MVRLLSLRLPLSLLLLAGCDAAPDAATGASSRPAGALTLFAAAPYDPPEPEFARQAYRAALGASLAEPPGRDALEPPTGEEDYMAAMARGVRIARARAVEESNDAIRESMASLALVSPRDCRWSAFDASGLTPPPPGKPPYPAHAYRCDLRVEHLTQRRGRVVAETEGHFFREDDGWVYVGGAAHRFKTIRDLELGL